MVGYKTHSQAWYRITIHWPPRAGVSFSGFCLSFSIWMSVLVIVSLPSSSSSPAPAQGAFSTFSSAPLLHQHSAVHLPPWASSFLSLPPTAQEAVACTQRQHLPCTPSHVSLPWHHSCSQRVVLPSPRKICLHLLSERTVNNFYSTCHLQLSWSAWLLVKRKCLATIPWHG